MNLFVYIITQTVQRPFITNVCTHIATLVREASVAKVAGSQCANQKFFVTSSWHTENLILYDEANGEAPLFKPLYTTNTNLSTKEFTIHWMHQKAFEVWQKCHLAHPLVGKGYQLGLVYLY